MANSPDDFAVGDVVVFVDDKGPFHSHQIGYTKLTRVYFPTYNGLRDALGAPETHFDCTSWVGPSGEVLPWGRQGLGVRWVSRVDDPPEAVLLGLITAELLHA